MAGNWSNSVGASGFTPNGGTVNFTDASLTSVIGGTNTFYNFTSTAAGKTLQFIAGTTQTVSNSFTITGTSASHITLASSSTSAWTISPVSSSVSYVTVSYSTATSVISPVASINGGNNNVNWAFAQPTSYTWSATPANSSWTNPANWLEGNGTYHPGYGGATGDAVSIPSSATYWPDLSVAAVTIGTISIASGGQIVLDKALTVGTSVTNFGTITINAGGSISKNDSANGGTVVLSAAGSLSAFVTTNSFANLSLTGSGSYSATSFAAMTGNLTIGSGATLVLANGNYTISGNLHRNAVRSTPRPSQGPIRSR